MSKNTDQYSRAIKLIATKLEKTKDRIQEKFYEVDDKFKETDKTLEGIQLKLSQEANASVDAVEFKRISDKVIIMENTISSLQKEITDLKSQIKKTPSATSATVITPSKKTSSPVTGIARTEISKIEVPKTDVPKQVIPKPPGAIPSPVKATDSEIKKTGIPTTPKSSIPSAPPASSKPVIPKAPTTDIPGTVSTKIDIPKSPPKKIRSLGSKDDAADKDNLLEALKSIDSLVVESDED